MGRVRTDDAINALIVAIFGSAIIGGLIAVATWAAFNVPIHSGLGDLVAVLIRMALIVVPISLYAGVLYWLIRDVLRKANKITCVES